MLYVYANCGYITIIILSTDGSLVSDQFFGNQKKTFGR